MKRSDIHTMIILAFYGGLPLGWIFAPVLHGYWTIYLGLLALYIIFCIRAHERKRQRRQNRKFQTYKIDKIDREEDAA